MADEVEDRLGPLNPDEEAKEDMASETTPPSRELSTPTQDELPQLISSLAPGVSASGIEAAASALRGLPLPTTTSDPAPKTASGMDEISDSEFNDEDLGNLALRPVERSGEERLSNVSSRSNSPGGRRSASVRLELK